MTSRLGLGCLWRSDGFDRSAAGAAAGVTKLINRALDGGVTLLDVPDPARDGLGPRLVGRAVAARRAEVLIAAHSWPASERAKDVAAECDRILRQLATDHLDLYYLHPPAGPARAAIPVEERIGPLTQLVAAGKIRHLGVYGAGPAELARAHAAHPVTALAVEYSMAARQAEEDLLPLARKLGIGVVACRPLGGGLLTGRCSGAADPTGAVGPTGPPAERSRLIRGLRAVAADLDVGVSRLALAWLLSRGDVVPVPNTANPVHLEMNLRSLEVGLPPDVEERLAALLDDTDGDGDADVESQSGTGARATGTGTGTGTKADTDADSLDRPPEGPPDGLPDLLPPRPSRRRRAPHQS
ncbi:aldo/keto reductase [Catenulispora yoronensis]|uniref:aldo/keto reductase n=1 Tax=Catenulispora yoronensis TaxID=450799 RepID=UPI0031CFD14F